MPKLCSELLDITISRDKEWVAVFMYIALHFIWSLQKPFISLFIYSQPIMSCMIVLDYSTIIVPISFPWNKQTKLTVVFVNCNPCNFIWIMNTGWWIGYAMHLYVNAESHLRFGAPRNKWYKCKEIIIDKFC